MFSGALFLSSILLHLILQRKPLFQATVCLLWWKSCLIYWSYQSCSLPGLVSSFQNDWLLSLVISLFPCIVTICWPHNKRKSLRDNNECCMTSVNGLFGIWFPSRLDRLPRWTPLQFYNLWTDWFPPKPGFVSTTFRFLKYGLSIQKDMDFCPIMFLMSDEEIRL